jgi:hypothetical protein
MKRFSWLILVALVCFACQRQSIMTRQGFAAIEPGMSIKQVEKLYGKPFSIHSRDADSEIYEYIERMMMGPETVAQYRYYLIISKGKVVGKYSKYSNPPAFEQIYSDDPYPNY